jgi:hypothetical protein
MNSPETLATLGTQDTGQINVREHRRGNQEWTIQRRWQHCAYMNNEYEGWHFTKFIEHLYLSCVLCAQCCHRLWTVHSWLPLRFSLTFICPVSLVPNVAVSLDCSFLIASSVFSNVYLCCVLCAQCFQCLDCSFLITSSVFSNVYLSCVLCAQCCQCLWIVHSWLPHWLFLTFICPVSCAPNVAH